MNLGPHGPRIHGGHYSPFVSFVCFVSDSLFLRRTEKTQLNHKDTETPRTQKLARNRFIHGAKFLGCP